MCKLHFARSRIVQSAPSNAASIDLNRPQVATQAQAQTQTWSKFELQVRTLIYLTHLIYLVFLFVSVYSRSFKSCCIFGPISALNSQFPILELGWLLAAPFASFSLQNFELKVDHSLPWGQIQTNAFFSLQNSNMQFTSKAFPPTTRLRWKSSTCFQ